MAGQRGRKRGGQQAIRVQGSEAGGTRVPLRSGMRVGAVQRGRAFLFPRSEKHRRLETGEAPAPVSVSVGLLWC